MRYFALTLLVIAALLPGSVGHTENAPEQLQIKTYRFQRHAQFQYERLVIEFQGGGSGKVGVSVSGSGSPARGINVSGARLTGAIPEAAINQSFSGKSRYLGELMFTPDVPGGFSVRAALKGAGYLLESFWLTNPSRLVIDAYPPTSPRSAGLGNLPDAQRARRPATSAPSRHSRAPRSSRSNKETRARQSLDDYLCFPARSQVALNVNFHDIQSYEKKDAIPVNLYGGPSAAPVGTPPDAIVCYPKSAEVSPVFTFSEDSIKISPVNIPVVTPKNLPQATPKAPPLPSFLQLPGAPQNSTPSRQNASQGESADPSALLLPLSLPGDSDSKEESKEKTEEESDD